MSVSFLIVRFFHYICSAPEIQRPEKSSSFVQNNEKNRLDK